jgi:hypothetical protein
MLLALRSFIAALSSQISYVAYGSALSSHALPRACHGYVAARYAASLAAPAATCGHCEGVLYQERVCRVCGTKCMFGGCFHLSPHSSSPRPESGLHGWGTESVGVTTFTDSECARRYNPPQNVVLPLFTVFISTMNQHNTFKSTNQTVTEYRTPTLYGLWASVLRAPWGRHTQRSR